MNAVSQPVARLFTGSGSHFDSFERGRTSGMFDFLCNPRVQARWIEFLGGTSLQDASCVYVAHPAPSVSRLLSPRPPFELPDLIFGEGEAARSLWDRRDLIADLDVEHVHFDRPREPLLERERSWRIQAPVVEVTQQLFRELELDSLHFLTGRGHHWIWRIPLSEAVCRDLALLGTLSSALQARYFGPVQEVGEAVGLGAGVAFHGLGKLMEYLGHLILWRTNASPIPVRLTAVAVPPGLLGREAQPILDHLEAISEAGFSILEICSFPAHLDYHDLPACERVAARVKQLGLEPYSLHAPFAAELDITSPNAQMRQRAIDEMFRAADAAATLGVRFYVIHPGPETGGIPRAERLDRMENAARALDRVAAHCRQLRLSLVLENMLPHLFAGPVRDLLWLLGAVDATDVGIYLDTGHAYLSGDLYGVAHKLSGHLWMLHASDNRGEFDDHLPPGEGHIAWHELFRQLAFEAFDGTVILEIAGGGDPAEILRGAQRARSFLRRLSGEAATGIRSSDGPNLPHDPTRRTS